MRRMLLKLRLSLVVLAACFSFAAVLPVTANAACSASASVCDACDGIGLTGSDCGGSGGGDKISTVVKDVINLLSAIVGIAAVIMIIIGGFRYVSSGGDSNAISGAKSTIIYAMVGLVIVAMAQLIVHLVIHTAGG